ncbi:PEP motif putative anchor domain protein [Thiorhodococcus drewsii AZ1]|uniref:PEP motif putative anchor domain protein n=1 Tax=Thiorhodococcus drewsii AZ1 TaxID=765913 RepID=G2E3J7_9GAMM|nr:PEP-CTERM sorting domain-containing protein [Thiorhodococcus drewsii]EGV30110.1 PEP motif putative anchor domain protein [Thiorhodococcus drewsii AZ1]
MKKLFLGAIGSVALMLGPVSSALACLDCDPSTSWENSVSIKQDVWEKNLLGIGSGVSYLTPMKWDWTESAKNSAKNGEMSVFLDMSYRGLTDGWKENWSKVEVSSYGSSVVQTIALTGNSLSVQLDAKVVEALAAYAEDHSWSDKHNTYYDTGLNFKFYETGENLFSNVFSLKSAKVSFDCTPTSVPVPAAAPLFLGGLGLVGWAGRRRRQKVASVS